MMRKFLAICLLWLAYPSRPLFGFDIPANGDVSENRPLVPAPSTDADADIESDLRSNDYQRRHQAMLRLWADRQRYHEWVETAAQDPDPEVSRRATWILERWRRGLLPDTPPEIAARIEGVTGPEAIENLLNASLFSGAVVAIDEALAGAAAPAVIDRARAALRRRFPFYVRKASETQQLSELVTILDRLADDEQTALAHHQLRSLVSGQSDIVLPSSAKGWTQARRQRILVILHASAGRLEEATSLSQQSHDIESLRVCRMLSSDWKTMAVEQAAQAKKQSVDSLDWYRHWMFALIAAARSGQPEIQSLAIEHLAKSRGGEKDLDVADPINRVRWQVLAMHGELDAALSIVRLLDRRDAAELMTAAMRLPDAFSLLDFNWQDLDAQLQAAVDGAIQGERGQGKEQGNARGGSSQLKHLLAIVRLLNATGRDELAIEALRQVVHHPSLAKQESNDMTRFEIIKTVNRLHRPDWLSDLAIDPRQTELPGVILQMVAAGLDAQPESLTALIDAFARLQPNRTFEERIRDVIGFLQGNKPAWLKPADYQTLYDLLESGATRGRRDDLFMDVMPQLSIDLARVFELHGQPQLAKQTLHRLASKGDVEATLKLAESELNEGSVQDAHRLFSMVWNLSEATGQTVMRLNQADQDGLAAIKAIQGDAIAAERLGDKEGAAQLNELIQLMCCTPSMSLRNDFAGYLVTQKRNEEAATIYLPMLRFVSLADADELEFYSVARGYELAMNDVDPSHAAEMVDLGFCGTLENPIFPAAAYVSLPSYVHQRRIHNAVKANDQALVLSELDKLFRLDPIDINFGEKELSLMREHGQKELATKTLERIYQAGKQHLDDFPLNINLANNLAWVLALGDHRLDEALQLSSRAVFYEPNSTIYRDTLAEVLFRLGRQKEAIAIERDCLLDDPSEWHVHEQIRRFEKQHDKAR